MDPYMTELFGRGNREGLLHWLRDGTLAINNVHKVGTTMGNKLQRSAHSLARHSLASDDLMGSEAVMWGVIIQGPIPPKVSLSTAAFTQEQGSAQGMQFPAGGLPTELELSACNTRASC